MKINYRVISKFYSLLDIFYFRNKEGNPRNEIVKLIPKGKVKILEVCVGTGENVNKIIEGNGECEVVGIDLSNDMIKIAEENFEKKGYTNAKTVVMDGTNMNFHDEIFDVVLISLVLHEVDERIRKGLLLEAKRVLKGEGSLIIMEWDKPVTFFKGIMFKIIELMEPKGFKEFLSLDYKKYLGEFELVIDNDIKCDYTRVINCKSRSHW